MRMTKDFPKRKPTRLKGFDYNNSGVYFITICTENREHILSQIVGGNEQSYEFGNVGGDVLDAPSSYNEQSFGRIPDAPKNIDNYNLFYENAYVKLLPFGIIADKYIKQMNNFYDNIEIDQYVIMPNHIHILLIVYDDKTLCNGASRAYPEGCRSPLDCLPTENGASRTSPPTVSVHRQHSVVSRFVSTFKRFCNKEYGYNIWQRHFNDHIIRNDEDYKMHLQYIYDNPVKWRCDELYLEL